jgi:hypothetical protein
MWRLRSLASVVDLQWHYHLAQCITTFLTNVHRNTAVQFNFLLCSLIYGINKVCFLLKTIRG